MSLSDARKRNIQPDACDHTTADTVSKSADVSTSDDDGDEKLLASSTSENEDLEEDSRKVESVRVVQGTDKIPVILQHILSGMSQKWKNGVVRAIFSIIMISGFSFIVFAGPVMLMLLVLFIQLMCYYEVINIGYLVYRTYKLPLIRTLGWYLLLWSNYFLYGEFLVDIFHSYVKETVILQFMVQYHRFLVFMSYVIGFVWFVLCLKKRFYFRQFSMFAYIHVTLMLIVVSSYLLIKNIFQGLIWFLLPVSLIICNDIMSYIFGFCFGRTPLIQLSPKKTWEGFIGGLVSTIVFCFISTYFLTRDPIFYCPVDRETYYYVTSCDTPQELLDKAYSIPLYITKISFTTKPIQLHCLAMALFSAVLGPFGGFFASGLKRAFKIKDFGDLIPGHGGMMDRFDCQLLMAAFVYVYLNNVIHHANAKAVMSLILRMTTQEQVELYGMLNEYLIDKNAL